MSKEMLTRRGLVRTLQIKACKVYSYPLLIPVVQKTGA